MTIRHPFKILFLCTGNSARSIFGEYLIRKVGKGRFKSYSAVRIHVHKSTLVPCASCRTLSKLMLPQPGRSLGTSMRDVIFDFVITVCDHAKETCPVWPGQPITAHWSSLDPADFKGSDLETYRYFWTIAHQIYRRVDLLCNLPFEKLDRLRLEYATRQIGQRETDL
jgi:arsenate reductase (thioredoxin)